MGVFELFAKLQTDFTKELIGGVSTFFLQNPILDINNGFLQAYIGICALFGLFKIFISVGNQNEFLSSAMWFGFMSLVVMMIYGVISPRTIFDFNLRDDYTNRNYQPKFSNELNSILPKSNRSIKPTLDRDVFNFALELFEDLADVVAGGDRIHSKQGTYQQLAIEQTLYFLRKVQEARFTCAIVDISGDKNAYKTCLSAIIPADKVNQSDLLSGTSKKLCVDKATGKKINCQGITSKGQQKKGVIGKFLDWSGASKILDGAKQLYSLFSSIVSWFQLMFADLAFSLFWPLVIFCLKIVYSLVSIILMLEFALSSVLKLIMVKLLTPLLYVNNKTTRDNIFNLYKELMSLALFPFVLEMFKLLSTLLAFGMINAIYGIMMPVLFSDTMDGADFVVFSSMAQGLTYMGICAIYFIQIKLLWKVPDTCKNLVTGSFMNISNTVTELASAANVQKMMAAGLQVALMATGIGGISKILGSMGGGLAKAGLKAAGGAGSGGVKSAIGSAVRGGMNVGRKGVGAGANLADFASRGKTSGVTDKVRSIVGDSGGSRRVGGGSGGSSMGLDFNKAGAGASESISNKDKKAQYKNKTNNKGGSSNSNDSSTKSSGLNDSSDFGSDFSSSPRSGKAGASSISNLDNVINGQRNEAYHQNPQKEIKKKKTKAERIRDSLFGAASLMTSAPKKESMLKILNQTTGGNSPSTVNPLALSSMGLNMAGDKISSSVDNIADDEEKMKKINDAKSNLGFEDVSNQMSTRRDLVDSLNNVEKEKMTQDDIDFLDLMKDKSENTDLYTEEYSDEEVNKITMFMNKKDMSSYEDAGYFKEMYKKDSTFNGDQRRANASKLQKKVAESQKLLNSYLKTGSTSKANEISSMVDSGLIGQSTIATYGGNSLSLGDFQQGSIVKNNREMNDQYFSQIESISKQRDNAKKNKDYKQMEQLNLEIQDISEKIKSNPLLMKELIGQQSVLDNMAKSGALTEEEHEDYSNIKSKESLIDDLKQISKELSKNKLNLGNMSYEMNKNGEMVFKSKEERKKGVGSRESEHDSIKQKELSDDILEKISHLKGAFNLMGQDHELLVDSHGNYHIAPEEIEKIAQLLDKIKK